MKKNSKIYVAGHTGLVGSAITKTLTNKGYTNLLLRDISEMDLTNQAEVKGFFEKEKGKFRDFTIRKGRRIPTPNQYIEKRRFRLDSPTEIRNIQAAKRRAPTKKRRTKSPRKKRL